MVAFVSSKADLVINASGTALIQTVAPYSGLKKSTPSTVSFNNKYTYNLISNAVANVGFWADGDIPPTTLPADGCIAFNQTAIITNSLMGVFYVTNKAGFYYPLSGLDTNGEYYSWMELDSQDEIGYAGSGFRFGFDDQIAGGAPFNGVAAYNINSSFTGTQTFTSTALLYIHDDPYSYDDGDYPNICFENYRNEGNSDDIQDFNQNAIEVRGIFTMALPFTDSLPMISRFTVTGSGNFLYKPNIRSLGSSEIGVVKNAAVKFAK